MADRVEYHADAQGRQIPTHFGGSPGISGAILDAVKALAGAFAPRSVVQRPAAIDQAVNAATGAQPQQLGNQF